MTTKIELQQQIQTLQQQIVPSKKESNKIELEIEIDRLARRVIETPLPPTDRQALITELLRTRTQLIQHFPVNGIKGTALYLNAIQNTFPTPLCPAYNKMGFPTVSTYHSIGSNIACIRLDPKALDYVPNHVLEKAGSLQGKEIDLFWTAVDGRFCVGAGRSLNHSSHPWAHQHALPGPEKIVVNGKEENHPHSNIAFDVNMGIFPEMGLESSKERGAIAINQISPMNVHIHARGGIRDAKSADMLYSPDNAHFNVTPGSPFSIDWSLMQKDHRIAITKRIVLFDYNHPICAALLHAIRNCPSLETHLQRLDLVPIAIEKTLLPLINAFESKDPNAMQAFHQLPLAFQHSIYYEAWASFDSPRGIHRDFGRASFENDNSLDMKYHCDDHRRAEAIRRFSAHLEHLLVGSQSDLLFRSQSLIKGDNILTMMKCAQLFYKEPKRALDAFGQLSNQEQEAIHFAFWELKGCQRIHNFSTRTFPLNCELKEERELKAQAILLAASRQSHQFKQPIVERFVPIQTGEADVLNEVVKTLEEPDFQDSKTTEDPRFDALVIRNPTVIPTQKKEVRPDVQIPLSHLLVSQQLMELVFNPEFQFLDNSSRAARVNELLVLLEKDLRNGIYGSVYSNSSDPQKGGESWGEHHVADDLNVLINAIQETLPNLV